MAVHAKNIEFQKDSVRRALKSMLSYIDKDTPGIESRVIPVLTYLTDKNMATRLKTPAKNTVKSLTISKHMK